MLKQCPVCGAKIHFNAKKCSTCVCLICPCGKRTNSYKAIYCSPICRKQYMDVNACKVGARKGGLKSQLSQNLRSKNEVFFFDLVKVDFQDALANPQMFEGWDADIVLPVEKVAVMWNGNWHYKTLRKGHSVAQQQARDKVKIAIIHKLGFTTFTVKDIGAYNPSKVAEVYTFFKNWLTGDRKSLEYEMYGPIAQVDRALVF